jgi:hypothetical protein
MILTSLQTILKPRVYQQRRLRSESAYSASSCVAEALPVRLYALCRVLCSEECGAGVETAAEIYDFCQEDIMAYVRYFTPEAILIDLTLAQYPKICREEVSIHVIQSREHILNTVSHLNHVCIRVLTACSTLKPYRVTPRSVALSCIFQRPNTLLGQIRPRRSRAHHIRSVCCIPVCIVPDSHLIYSVGAVTPQHVIYTVKNAEGNTEQHTIPSNFVLWSTGIAMNPFTERVSSLLPNQVHKKAIEVDAHLRVKGAPLGTVYAIGDCSTVRLRLVVAERCVDGIWGVDRNVSGEPPIGFGD